MNTFEINDLIRDNGDEFHNKLSTWIEKDVEVFNTTAIYVRFVPDITKSIDSLKDRLSKVVSGMMVSFYQLLNWEAFPGIIYGHYEVHSDFADLVGDNNKVEGPLLRKLEINGGHMVSKVGWDPIEHLVDYDRVPEMGDAVEFMKDTHQNLWVNTNPVDEDQVCDLMIGGLSEEGDALEMVEKMVDQAKNGGF